MYPCIKPTPAFSNRNWMKQTQRKRLVLPYPQILFPKMNRSFNNFDINALSALIERTSSNPVSKKRNCQTQSIGRVGPQPFHHGNKDRHRQPYISKKSKTLRDVTGILGYDRWPSCGISVLLAENNQKKTEHRNRPDSRVQTSTFLCSAWD